FLKSNGYTTIVFSELNSDFLFAAMPSIEADLVYEKPGDYQQTEGNLILSDFEVLVLKDMVFSIWLEQADIINPSLEMHKEMLFFTLDKLSTLEATSPKFVYV